MKSWILQWQAQVAFTFFFCFFRVIFLTDMLRCSVSQKAINKGWLVPVVQATRVTDTNQRPRHWQMAEVHLVCQCSKNDHKVGYALEHCYLVIDATKACPQVLGQIQSASSWAPCCRPQCQIQGFKFAIHIALGDIMKGLHLDSCRHIESASRKKTSDRSVTASHDLLLVTFSHIHINLCLYAVPAVS